MKMHLQSTRWPIFSCLLLIAVAKLGVAADCEPFLVPDFAFPQRDVTTDLAYLSVISAANFPLHKKNAEAGLDPSMDQGIFQTNAHVGLDLPIANDLLQASANFAEFEQKRESKFQEYQFKYSSEDLAKYYIRLFPQQRARLYVNCLQNAAPPVRIAQADRDFVELLVIATPSKSDAITNTITKVTVSGGALSGSAPIALKPGQETSVLFTRHLDKDLRVSASIEGTPVELLVPRFILADAIGVANDDAQCASAAKVVGSIHRQVLGKDPDPASATRQIALLEGKINSVRQLVEHLVIEPAYARAFVNEKSDEEVLTGLYRHILAREPDPSGLAYNQKLFAKLGYQKLAMTFAGSYEYQKRFGEWIVPGATPAMKYCGKK